MALLAAAGCQTRSYSLFSPPSPPSSPPPHPLSNKYKWFNIINCLKLSMENSSYLSCSPIYLIFIIYSGIQQHCKGPSITVKQNNVISHIDFLRSISILYSAPLFFPRNKKKLVIVDNYNHELNYVDSWLPFIGSSVWLPKLPISTILLR